MQPVLAAELARHRDFGPSLRGVDLAAVLDAARALLAERPHTGAQLRTALGERFPVLDPAAARVRLSLPPPARPGAAARSVASSRPGRARRPPTRGSARPLAPAPSIDDVVLRYLGAFGPATPGDVAAWSRLTGFREILERLRPRLRAFRDERGRELFDLPDAPRPDPDTPVPPRFLPEYDNVLLSHADRSRFVSQDNRSWLFDTPVPVHGTVLHDGFMAGTWSIDRDGGAVLTIRPVVRLSKRGDGGPRSRGATPVALPGAGRRRARRPHRFDQSPGDQAGSRPLSPINRSSSGASAGTSTTGPNIPPRSASGAEN